MLVDKDNITALVRFMGAIVVLLVATTCGAKPTTKSFDPPLAPDGKTLNTAALQSAIDTLSARGGGTLSLAAGQYLTGTIQLKDNVTLHLDQGATLLGSTNPLDYRNPDPFTAGDGAPLGYGLVVAVDAKNVGLTGPGTIDGQGKILVGPKPYKIRPFLTRWVRCQKVLVSKLREQDPGAWTNHFFQCSNVQVSATTVRSSASRLPNNDGIDIDSCENVHIADCDIDSGDDAICLKATSARACRDISVTGCTLKTRCNAIKLGTESLGDFTHIRIENCHIRDAALSGIALYSVDGAALHDVQLNDITMDSATVPISIRLGARLKTFRPGDQAKPPGTLRDVSIKNLSVAKAGRIGLLINGIPDHPVEALSLENIQMEVPGGGTAENASVRFPEKIAAYPEMTMFGKIFPASAAYLRHVRGITLKNVRFTTAAPDARPAAFLIDVEGATSADFNVTPASATEPTSK